MIKRKRSMTSFDVAAAISEISKRARGARLYNIYAYDKGFLFRFKSPGSDLRLVAVPGERLHITRYDVSEKGMPPPLVMGLRKYLRNAVLENVYQIRFDRIVKMELRQRNETFYVVVELLPRGVLVLLDSAEKIIQTSSVLRLRDREIRRSVRYVPPPGSSIHPQDLGVQDIERILRGEGCDPLRSLVRGLGYPGEVVEEALLRAGIDPATTSCEQLLDISEQLASELKKIYEESLRGRGYIVFSGDEPLTVVPFNPIGLGSKYGFLIKSYNSFSEALDEFFVEAIRRTEEEKRTASIEAERAKLVSSIEQARRNLEQLGGKVKLLEKRAQLIAENMQLIYDALGCVNRVRERSGWEYVIGNCPGVVDVKPSEGKVSISIKGEIIDIDVRKDPSQIIVELYRRIGELRAKIERGEKALRELEERLRNLERRQQLIRTRARAVVRRREWYEKYHWLVTSHGYLAIGGRDASQNESIVKRYLNEKRIFMHADIHGAPAVVVFNEGEMLPEEDLREAAILTAAYSKAWKTGITSVDVYWVWGSQVSKSPPPGEYISKGAFMVYGRRNYIKGVELRLAIGIGIEEEYPLIIVGPEDLIKRRSIVYAVIMPGEEDPSQLAKRIKKLAYKKAGEEYSEIISSLNAEEIRERLPGRSRLMGVHRGDGIEQPRPLRGLRGEAFQEN